MKRRRLPSQQASQHYSELLYSSEKRESTELSKYIWTLKDKRIDHKITWKILSKVNEKSNGKKNCKLCDMEMLKILEYKKKYGTNCLNKRREIANACRHRSKKKLKAWKWEKEE